MNNVEKYIKNKTWLVKENANSGYSFSGLMAYLGEHAIKEHMLENIYPPKISNAHKKGYFHIHDLGFGIISYCSGWPLRQLLQEGFGGMAGKIQSGPARHLSAALNQMVNFLGTLQMEFAGAQAFSSFDTYLAPFVAKDKLTYKEVKQEIQEFIFGLNIPSRFANQAPFTNLTFDWVCPEDLKNEHPKIGGIAIEETYGDFQKEMDVINKAFLEIMIKGDYKGRLFTFPIPTYNLTKDFVWDNDNAKLLFEMTAKYGTPYFQNYIGSGLNPEDIRSMCVPGTTEIIYKNSNGDISKNEIRHIVNNILKKNKQYEILVNGEFEKTKNAIKLKYEDNLIEIELENGIKQRFTKNHPCIIKNKKNIILAKKLKIGQEIPLRHNSYTTQLDSSEHGRMIGLYTGDGWIKQKVTAGFCFGKHEKHLIDFVKKFAEKNFLADTYIKEYDTYWTIFVKSKGFVNFIKEYINDGNCYTKRLLPSIYNKGFNFRKNVIIGMMESDGYIKSKLNCKTRIEIHIINKELLQDFQNLGYTVSQHTKLSSKKNKTGDKEKTSFVLYFKNGSIRDTIENRETINEEIYSKIKNIKISKFNGYVYDFEMDSKEHLFSLANGIITHNCCRLNIDKRELRKRGNGLFGAGEQTGSIGVVTINMPKLAYEASHQTGEKQQDKKYCLLDKIEKAMNYAKESLEIKRTIIKDNTNNGLVPYTKKYLESWRTYFSTIGAIGMNEMCLNLIGKDITTKEGIELSQDVLNFMRKKMQDFQEETGNLYNLEATPAEGTSFRLAQLDKKQYPDIITAGTNGTPYYTNSCHIPVNKKMNIIQLIKHQEQLQPLFTGGTVVHVFLGERVSDWINTMFLVKKIAENSKLPYFSITPTFSICPIHGYISGEHKFCPLPHTESDLKKYGISEE